MEQFRCPVSYIYPVLSFERSPTNSSPWKQPRPPTPNLSPTGASSKAVPSPKPPGRLSATSSAASGTRSLRRKDGGKLSGCLSRIPTARGNIPESMMVARAFAPSRGFEVPQMSPPGPRIASSVMFGCRLGMPQEGVCYVFAHFRCCSQLMIAGWPVLIFIRTMSLPPG